MTELIAAGGYPRVTIGALAARARVSRTAFYACFAHKEECAFAAYDRFIGALLAALAARASEAADMAGVIEVLLDGYFSTLERDLVATRAFLVEFEALGPGARERRRAALRGIAAYLRRMHDEFRASDPTLAPVFAEEVYLGIVYIARQLACDALDEQPRPALKAIGATLVPWLQTVYRPVANPAPADDARA
jgi:AcrR family transcriptional regulator